MRRTFILSVSSLFSEKYFLSIIKLAILLLLYFHSVAFAGKHCGAEGDWRSSLIPDKWPPPVAKKQFQTVMGKVKTVSVNKACREHDDCYDTGGVDQHYCDHQFLVNMKLECDKVYTSFLEIHIRKACHFAAKGYYEAVQKYGSEAFKKAQNSTPTTTDTVLSRQQNKMEMHHEEVRTAIPSNQSAGNKPLVADAFTNEDINHATTSGTIVHTKQNTGVDNDQSHITNPDVLRDLLFENSDFEKGNLFNWTQSGQAFLFQPVKGDNVTARGRGHSSLHHGSYWIGTYEKYQGGPNEKPGDRQGDKPTGTLRSISFDITGKKICFLIGGGRNIDKISVSLIIQNQVTHSVTGENSEVMKRIIWDVANFQGQKAYILIQDNFSGGWGHINIDDFRFL